jgi:hypothetical protein
MNELTLDMTGQKERITVFTPLGIRFWDPVENIEINDNLEVKAWPENSKSQITKAIRTSSGIYSFHGLPGLHTIEYPSTRAISFPFASKSFIVGVNDVLRRFLPVVFRVYLPLPYMGIFLMNVMGSPPGDKLPGFFLFSAPTRTSSLGIAEIRGQLIEKSTQRPAAHAILEVEVNYKKWYGIADDRGCIVILFPYPAIIGTFFTSPPEKRLILPLNQQKWEMTIRARYDPSTLYFPPGTALPELRSILNQNAGVLWFNSGQYSSEITMNLIFDQESILRTDGLDESILWIDRGSSPV